MQLAHKKDKALAKKKVPQAYHQTGRVGHLIQHVPSRVRRSTFRGQPDEVMRQRPRRVHGS